MDSPGKAGMKPKSDCEVWNPHMELSRNGTTGRALLFTGKSDERVWVEVIFPVRDIAPMGF
jgi:hypothetical protein